MIRGLKIPGQGRSLIKGIGARVEVRFGGLSFGRWSYIGILGCLIAQNSF